MKFSKPLGVVITTAACLVALPITITSQTNNSVVLPKPADGDEIALIDSIQANNSLRFALWQFAAERFSLNESRSQRWVLGLNPNAISIEKFSDGQITLVLLPKLHDDDDLGMGEYVKVYNQRWPPSFGPLSAENKMDSQGLLSGLLLCFCRCLCALNPFGKERTSRAWHCPSSLSLLFGFQFLPPQAVSFQVFLSGFEP